DYYCQSADNNDHHVLF
nr:immunoglobulin light chain junction region [Macaca mulatta]